MKTLRILTILTLTTFGCSNKQTPKDEKATVTETEELTDTIFKQVADFPTIKDTTKFIDDLRQIFGQNEISNIYGTKEYKIKFPYTPEKMTQPLPTTLGELLMTILSCEPKSTAMDENYVYLLMETDYPDTEVHSDKTDILEKFFRGSVDGAVVNVKGKLIKETVGKVSQYPSRTIEIDYGNGIAIIKMKMILKESKMIIIQTITETKKYPNKSIDAFFDSFLIK